MFQNKDGTLSVKKIVITVIVLLIVAVLAMSSFVVIPAGHTGVSVTFGKVSDVVLQEGLHAKIPFAQDIVTIDNRIVKLEVSTEAFSKDLQTVSAVIAVNYRIAKDQSYSIYKNVGNAYESVLVVPAVNEVLKAVVAQYTASEVVGERSKVSVQLDEQINAKLNGSGIFVEDLNVIDWDFSAEYIAAVEQKQVAEQNLIKTRTEQEQELVVAEAQAKKQLMEAEAEAKRIMLEAEAQAEANKLLSESLNQNLIDYEQVQKWDGKLPQVQLESGSGTLLGINVEE